MNQADNKPVIFLAFANDRENSNHYLRSLNQELEALRIALEPTESEYTVKFEPNIGIERLFKIFRDYRDRIAVFHFAGHANSYQLLLESINNQPAVLDAGGFAAFLAQQLGLGLVVLNGCSTRAHVDLLLAANVPFVIATSTAVDDRAAAVFAAHLYANLASGRSIARAFAEAEAQTSSPTGLGLWRKASTMPSDADHRHGEFPWQLYPQSNGDAADTWTLSALTDDPMFGLPAIPKHEFPAKRLFLGLERFTRDDAEIFFGRGRAIRALYNHMTTETASPLVLLHGQTGVGKSSLLDAGLAPRLAATHTVLYAQRQAQLGALGTLHQILATQHKETAIKPTVVILDQLETIFTDERHTETEQEQEMRTLGDALTDLFNAHSTLRLIFGFRTEYLSRIGTHLRTLPFRPAQEYLQPLDRQGVLEVIEGPIRSERLTHFGLHFEEQLRDGLGLSERIANTVVDSDSPTAPVLQILLTEMFTVASQRNPVQPRFDHNLLDELGENYSHLTGFLEQQLRKLEDWAKLEPARENAVKSGLVLDVLHFHTTVNNTAAQQPMSKIFDSYRHRKDILPGLLEQLKKPPYLLTEVSTLNADGTPNMQVSEATTQLAHDTLAMLVRRRYEKSDLPGQKARWILESRVRDSKDLHEDVTLTKRELDLVESGLQGMQGLNSEEKLLLAKSRRVNTRRAIVVTAIRWTITLTVLGFLATLGFGFSKQEEANKNAVLGLMAQGLAKLDSGYDLGLLLLLQANKLNDTWPTRSSLFQGIQFDPRLITTLSTNANRASKISISPDGKTLAVASGSGKLYLWDVQKHTLIREFPPKLPGFLSAVAFSADGNWLATGGEARDIVVWNTQTWKSQILDTGHQGWVHRIAFGPIKSQTILASASQDGSIKIWDFSKKRSPLLREIREPDILPNDSKNEVFALDFSNDGQFLASGGKDAKIRLWNVNTGRLTRELPGDDEKRLNRTSFHKKSINDLVFHPRQDILASVSDDRTIILWNIKTGKPIAKPFLGHTREVNSVAFSPDGTLMLTGSSDGAARLWDVASNQAYGEPFTGHVGSVVSLSFSPNGNRLMTATSQGSIYIWRASQRKTMGTRMFEPYEEFSAMAVDQQTKAIMTGTLKGSIQIWDKNKGKPFKYLQIGQEETPKEETPKDKEEREILSIALHPRMDVVAVSTRHGSLQFRNTKTLRLIAKHENLGQIFGVAFHPKGDLMVSGGSETTITLWETKTPSPKPYSYLLAGHQGQINALQFSPDGNTLASGDITGRIILWDIGQCQPTKAPCQQIGTPIVGHLEFVRALAFSPDGRMLASAGKDRVIRLWDVKTHESIGRPLAGHTAVVSSLVFSGNSQTLVSGSFDGTLIVWDVLHQRALGKPLSGHTGSVRGIAFMQANEDLVSVSEDKTILLRTIGQHELQAQICQKANRNLTDSEWRDFLGDSPYQKTCPVQPDSNAVHLSPRERSKR
jgi:WD40 repeat protein